MSEALRIALVAEGPTDRIVIEAALRAILGQRTFVLTQLQPEGSVAFGKLGTGWAGVYRWCKQSAVRGGGRLSDDRLVYERFNLLILHIDAAVAAQDYSEARVSPDGCDGTLPCERPCPPPSATTNSLREVVLSWSGEPCPPPRTVFCTPSKGTEAWVVAALFPDDQAVKQGIECLADPASRLGQQKKNRRIRKTQHDYQAKSAILEEAWPHLVGDGGLDEAARFEQELLAVTAAL